MGWIYRKGLGVPINNNEAIKWYKKAAKGGEDLARLRLIRAYLYGNMVAKDVGEALKWYNLVGRGLDGADLCNIGYAYDTGDTISMNKSKAVEFYRLAPEKGDSVAQYNLGVCYENGNGVSCDINVAKYWYEKAAEQGYSQAQQCVSRLNSKIQSQKHKEIVTSIIICIILGSIYGAIGYYTLIDILPKWGIQIPEVWHSICLIVCIIIGVIIAFFIMKSNVMPFLVSAIISIIIVLIFLFLALPSPIVPTQKSYQTLKTVYTYLSSSKNYVKKEAGKNGKK